MMRASMRSRQAIRPRCASWHRSRCGRAALVGRAAGRRSDGRPGCGSAGARIPPAGPAGLRRRGKDRRPSERLLAALNRPREVCRELLAALEASEGRRKRRKRDTTPDAIGLAIKRDLLDRAVAADPDADQFEAWLLEQCAAAGPAEGGMRAMALSIFEEWHLALSAESFGDWLAQGAPSDDASGDLTP